AGGASSFASAPINARRTIIESALGAAKLERLPPRPNGVHVAGDLMAHYFHSSEAEDLCYGRAIGRDVCRGLAGSEKLPPALPRRPR
ncbi:MAG TPA: hypothetical protein VGL62_01095, partial [Vicinamibacterales bacterium]